IAIKNGRRARRIHVARTLCCRRNHIKPKTTTAGVNRPFKRFGGNEERASLPLMLAPARLAVGLEPLSVPVAILPLKNCNVSPDPVSGWNGSPAGRTRERPFGRQTLKKVTKVSKRNQAEYVKCYKPGIKIS